jgi:zinc protease
VAALEQAIQDELTRVKTKGISEAELNRVKAQVIAADVYQRDSLFYQAMQLGEQAVAGLPPEALDRRVEKLRAVTAQQVQEVARNWLKDDGLSVAVLDPQPLDSAPRRPRMAGVRHGN